MLEEMDADELATWHELYRQDPWTEGRADLRAGIIACVVAGSHGVRDAKPSDYMPTFGEREGPQEMDDDAILAAIVKTNALLGGEHRKG